jgi:hypothetical protein
MARTQWGLTRQWAVTEILLLYKVTINTFVIGFAFHGSKDPVDIGLLRKVVSDIPLRQTTVGRFSVD